MINLTHLMIVPRIPTEDIEEERFFIVFRKETINCTMHINHMKKKLVTVKAFIPNMEI